MSYAVFYVSHLGDQQVTNPLDYVTAHDMAIALQADSYLEDPESCGEIFGNYVVMPLFSTKTSK